MATAPITDLLDAMADLIQTVVASVDGVVVVPRLDLNPSGLCVDIYPGDPSRDFDAGGFGEASGAWVFTVRARADFGDNAGAQDILLRLMDDEDQVSVAMALFDDQTLNGLATSVRVDGPSGFIAYADNPGNMIGVEWRVTVLRALS